jgi:hypothetical protein
MGLVSALGFNYAGCDSQVCVIETIDKLTQSSKDAFNEIGVGCHNLCYTCTVAISTTDQD